MIFPDLTLNPFYNNGWVHIIHYDLHKYYYGYTYIASESGKDGMILYKEYGTVSLGPVLLWMMEEAVRTGNYAAHATQSAEAEGSGIKLAGRVSAVFIRRVAVKLMRLR